MFSNSIKTMVGAISIGALLLAGCDTRVGESAPPPEVREYQGGKCLTESLPVFGKFFSGKAQDSEIASSWDCLASAVSQVRRYVRGRDGDRITPAEFATFLEDNFMQGGENATKITPALQLEVMKLKQVFIGGSRDYVTMTELDALAQLMKQIKAIALQVNPSMLIFSQNWVPNGVVESSENVERFEQANRKIQSAARQFADLIRKDSSTYVISDAVVLTKEISELTRTRRRIDRSLETYLPIIKKVKKTVSGGSEDVIAPNEWRNFLMLGARGYVQYLRYFYFIEGASDPQGQVKLEFASRTVADTISLLRDLIEEKPGRTISRAELEELFRSVSEVWPEIKSSPKLIDEIMRVKQALLGGSLDALTGNDFANAGLKVDVIHRALARVLPYYDLYVKKWQAGADEESKKYFSQAQSALIISLREVGGLFETDYDLKNLEVLAREVITLYPDIVSKPQEVLKDVQKYVDLVVQAKNFLFDDKDSVLKASQWDGFLGIGARVYTDYLYYSYFFDGAGKDIPAIVRIEQLAREIFILADEIIGSRPQQNISTDDLAQFLEKISAALPDIKVSRRLVDEVMALKPLFFGGTSAEFTRQDFAKIQSKFPALKALAERLAPYWPVYTSNWKVNSSSQQARAHFTAAGSALELSLQELSGLIESSYNLNRIPTLVGELLRLYPHLVENPQEFGESIRKNIPLLVEAKNAIFTEKDSILRQERWAPSLRLGGHSYMIYLQYVYFAKDQGFKTARGLGELQLLTDEGFSVLQDILNTKASHAFTPVEMRGLVALVGRLGILPKSFDVSMVNSLVDIAIRRVLVSPEQRLGSRPPRVFNAQSLQVAQFELNTWMEIERFHASLFPRGDESYTASRLRAAYNAKYAERGLPATLNAGLKEMLLVTDSQIPLIVDGEGRLQIADRSGSYKRDNVSTLNMYRMLARTFNRAYSSSLDRLRSYSGVNLAEVQTAFGELKPIAVRLGVIEASNTTFASSRFREANMFTSRADGNSLLSFQEMTDLITMLMSGVAIDKSLKADLVKYCNGGRSAQNSTLLDKDCVFNVYRSRIPTQMRSMPYAATYVKSMPDEIWGPYFENLMKAAGYVPRGQNLVQFGDAAQVPHVMQYIEMIYSKFDRNRDWVIDVNEAMQAFPLFRGVIKEVAKGEVGDEDLDDVYTYILKNGKPPMTFAEKASFALNWRNKPQNWVLQSDRTLLVRILGFIADQTNKPATQQ